MILGPSGENIYPEEIEAIFNEQDAVIETLVYQQENKLVARVHLDYDKLDEEFGSQNLSESQIQQKIHDLLADLRSKVNARVSSFSKIHTVLEQPEPFEKTPTQKVKRYLYVNQT
jgi:long-chain acyl-CoA synthetase